MVKPKKPQKYQPFQHNTCFQFLTQNFWYYQYLHCIFIIWFGFIKIGKSYVIEQAKKINPFWRTFFLIFWIYPCFNQIKNDAKCFKLDGWRVLPALAVVYVLMELFLNAYGRLPANDILDSLGFLTMAAAVGLLFYVNKTATKINFKADPGFKNNSRFTVWN
jgi:hypothetical protein